MNKGINFLLTIAIDQYRTPEFQPLKNAVSDAKALIKILEDKYDFTEHKYLFDEYATTEEITNALVELKNLMPEDNLIIFFSGHGFQDSDSKKGHMVPINATKRSDFIPFSLIKGDYLEVIKAAHVLVIFDCCYSANFISRTRGSLKNTKSIEKIRSKPSRFFLGSGGEEKVSDGRAGGNSPFMHFLLDFLDSNTQKEVLTTEIATYIRRNVGDSAAQQPVYEPIIIEGHITGGEFVFVLNDKLIDQNSTLISNNNYPILKEDFLSFLNDAGAMYLHSRVDIVKLNDIFIEPNLKVVDIKNKTGKNKAIENQKLWSLLSGVNGKIKIIISGNETSGKTAICKQIYLHYYQKGFVPVFIDAGEDIKEIKRDKLVACVKKCFDSQYNIFDFEKIERSKMVLIIDDFHKFSSTKNKDYKNVLIKNINIEFENAIIVGNTIAPLELIASDKRIKNTYSEYSFYQTMEFGPSLRHELIKKWYLLGQDPNLIDKNEQFREYDDKEQQIKIIIGKNYIPSYPFYLLSIIQTLENAAQNSNYSLHGFYYENLINQQLSEAVKNKEDISLYYNYITDFSYFLFESKEKSISMENYIGFHTLYVQKYAVNYSSLTILKNLRDAKILEEVNGFIRINYKYVYYFFVAKYISNNLSKTTIRDVISKMCKRLYREEYSNIIMFLTHLSRDPYVIGEILNNAKSIFSDHKIAKLDKGVDNINQLISEMPSQVIKLVNTEEVRKNALEEKEKVESIEREYERTNQDKQDYDLDEDVNDINLLSQVTLSVKTIEILGQLAKKYWGSMTADEKLNISIETYFLGLRTLGKYLEYMQANSELLVAYIKDLVIEKNPKDRIAFEKTVKKIANNVVFSLCFLMAYAIIRKIGISIGYKKLYTTFNDLAEKYPENSIKLINLFIHLNHDEKIPIEDIENLNNEFKTNKLCILVLQTLVLDRLYYFEEDFGKVQKISHILNIPIGELRRIEGGSKVKKK